MRGRIIREVKEAGRQVAFARANDISTVYLNAIIKGRENVSDSMAKKFGFQKTYVLIKEDGKKVTQKQLVKRVRDHFKQFEGTVLQFANLYNCGRSRMYEILRDDNAKLSKAMLKKMGISIEKRFIPYIKGL